MKWLKQYNIDVDEMRRLNNVEGYSLPELSEIFSIFISTTSRSIAAVTRAN
jgi:hypothetical protein